MERRSLSLVSPAPSTPMLTLSTLLSSPRRAASLRATAALSMAMVNVMSPAAAAAAAAACFDVCFASGRFHSVLMRGMVRRRESGCVRGLIKQRDHAG